MAIIKVTEAAASHIAKMIEKNHGVGLRFSVKKTGCSGYSYYPAIVEKAEQYPNDVVMMLENGVKIFIDQAWLDLLDGLVVDFQEEKTGLKQTKLIYTNPKEASRCGCGESFHLDKDKNSN